MTDPNLHWTGGKSFKKLSHEHRITKRSKLKPLHTASDICAKQVRSLRATFRTGSDTFCSRKSSYRASEYFN